MKNALHLSLLIILLSLATNFNAFAQQRINQNLSGFTSIQIGSGLDVYLSQGNTESVEIEAKEEVFDYLVVEVDRNNNLIIRLDNTLKSWFSRRGPVKAYVSFKDLNNIKLSGGSDLYGQGPMEFNHLNISVSGGSDIRMNLQANELEVSCSGGSDAMLEGYAAYFKGKASGGADLKAKDLETEVAEISVSGGSDAYIRVKRELNASASGGSDIVYYGRPEKLITNTSGGSDITARH